MIRRSPRPKSSPDYLFIFIVGLLVLFGLVMLASASSDLAKIRFGDSFYYVKHQVLYGVLLGIIGFAAGSMIYYQRWRRWAIVLLLLNIAGLFLVFTPLGFSAKGAARWLDIGGLSLQPGELLKLTFLIYLASWITKNKHRGKSFTEGFLPFIILLGTIVILLLMQPSTTTAVIIFATSLILYFIAGAKFRFLIASILLAVVGLSALIYTSPYRLERVATFLNPAEDELGSAYHINQSLIAIGSGGVIGTGYGKSTTKLDYLPEPLGDSIFAIIAEELGFIGASVVLFLFIALIIRGFHIARKVSEPFGQLLVMSFISLIGLQTFVNIAAISGIIPLTGIPLPFISFGGTSMAVFMTMSGLIVNVSRYNR